MKVQMVAWSRDLPTAYRQALRFGAGLPPGSLRRKLRWRGGTWCVRIHRYDIR